MSRLYYLLIALMMPFLGFSQLSTITDITLTFTPESGSAVTATASDSGSGLTVDGPINLIESTDYTLTLSLSNSSTDINAEISTQAANFQFFFEASEGVLEGSTSYNDSDSNNLPVGLDNSLTSGCVEESTLNGTLRVVLGDLTGSKSANSTISDAAASAVFDLSWEINVADDADAPECENEEEVIDKVTLTFTPEDGDPIVAEANDPDGPGPLGLTVDDISLMESTDYTLTIMLENTIEGEDITAEILAEDDEHQFFFAFGEDLFEDPDGDGNIDNSLDPINYNDMDDNGLPVGLSTAWTTACTEDGNVQDTFRIVLKHQPDGIKTDTSGFEDGGTDIDITWNITLVDDPDAPECENEEELIDKVTLTFTPEDGDPVIAEAIDPDGPGPLPLAVNDISLMESTDYTLTVMVENTIEGEDITAEILEEDDEHQFFFAFGEDLFEDPDGDGNIDNSSDPINYNDMDDNGLPVGLSTAWTTACTEDGNVQDTFRVVLKHQPGIKDENSGFEDGGTDIDITWNITLVDDPDAPECENEEELIDKVTLTFTPEDGDPVIAEAIDPDGPGPLPLAVNDISLMESTDYTLTVMVENTIEGEDITAEIMEEDDEHQFFFAFGEDLFEDPDGDGNIDNSSDPINYNDMDDNGLPVGLSTAWTTACTEDGNVQDTFRVVLKHQPGIKDENSGFEDGGTDIDITWNITLVDDPDAPECENEEELIDKVTLTFTPDDGSETVVSEAIDPDGPGPMPLATSDVALMQNTNYELSITVENTIEGEDITAEIMEEDDEHQFFFAWTGDIFSDPTGDGNIDNATDPVNYNDQDDNGLPVGLSTNWTTNVAMTGGTFRVVLKHQPDIKSPTSTFEDGGTDIDITWNINSVVSSLDNLSEGQSITIAPNPVRDQLNLILENIDLYGSKISIYNNLGVLTKVITNPSNSILVSDLASGNYFLQIKGDNLLITRRFIKN